MTNLISRRGFGAGLAGGFMPVLRADGAPVLKRRGVLVRDCPLPGETRKDDVVPAHPNGIPVSRNRWLVLYATRGFRGVDDDLSIVWQLRRDAPDGAVIREGFFAQTRNDWHAMNDGGAWVRQHGHPVGFGVPKGARIGGRPAANANVFVAKWRRVARAFNKERNEVEHATARQESRELTLDVEWVQFRLNEREDNIELLGAPAELRPAGHPRGPLTLDGAKTGWMNQSFVQAVPFNRGCTEWIDCNHFQGGRVAPLRYRFDEKRGRYDWVQTGPLMTAGKTPVSEASIAPYRDGWVIAARLGEGRGVAWLRTDDPFRKGQTLGIAAEPPANSPLTLYRCADGRLRLLTGDAAASPYKASRNPLYMWDVEVESGFRAHNRAVVFDTFAAKLPVRPESQPKVDMAKILPAVNGRHYLVHRFSVRSYNQLYEGSAGIVDGIPVINQQEKDACAIYYATLDCQPVIPTPWEFA